MYKGQKVPQGSGFGPLFLIIYIPLQEHFRYCAFLACTIRWQ